MPGRDPSGSGGSESWQEGIGEAKKVLNLVFGDHGTRPLLAPAIVRKQQRGHSWHYLQPMLVQSQERRDAKTLSESVGVSARALQPSLTDSRWECDAVMGRLQEYLGHHPEHPEAIWVRDGSDFPRQAKKSAGVAREYCGS